MKRITYTIIPHKTGIRLLGVARNPANGFPARLLGAQVDRALYVGDSSHDLEAAVRLEMPFLLVDSGIYVRGEAREKLRVSTMENGYPIVELEGLLDIEEILRTHAF